MEAEISSEMEKYLPRERGFNTSLNKDLSKLTERGFDAVKELRRVLYDLRFDIPLKENIFSPKERESQSELDGALRTIDKARKNYFLRLKNALASGQIDREDYFGAERDATHSFERFAREIWERYN